MSAEQRRAAFAFGTPMAIPGVTPGATGTGWRRETMNNYPLSVSAGNPDPITRPTLYAEMPARVQLDAED